MKNLTWQNPEQLFVAQELINKVKSKCCGIKDIFVIERNEKIAINSDWLPNIMFRMKKQEYKEQERHYYFFDYLFWLGEITWEHYHKVSFKQPRGSDMLWACITFFIFMPVLTIGGHFLDDLAFEVFGAVLLIVSSVSVFMTDRLFGKIYPPSRRKAVMQHYAGRKFSPFRRNLFFFPLYLLLIPAMVLLGTALKWITEILK